MEVVSITGIAKSTLARMETEQLSIKSDIAVTLSNLYDVSVDYLLGNTDERKPTFKIADQDGTVTEIQYKLIDETKGLTIADMEKIFEYVDFIKSKGDKNEK